MEEKITLLKSPPIIEAICQIDLSLPDDLDIKSRINDFYEDIKESYPERNEIPGMNLNININKEIKESLLSSSPVPSINRFINSDKKQIFSVFGPTNFSLSRLSPYISWEQFQGEIVRLRRIYNKFFQPTIIKRIALRYINNIKIPYGREFENYFTASPKIPPNLPQSFISFMSNIVVYEESINAIGRIIHVFNPPPQQDNIPEFINIILDIDVYKANDKGIKEDEVEYTLEQLRLYKNKIFFGSITEKLKETLL